MSMKKEITASDYYKEWRKNYCKKGDTVMVLADKNCFVVYKVNPTYVMTFEYKDKKPRKKTHRLK